MWGTLTSLQKAAKAAAAQVASSATDLLDQLEEVAGGDDEEDSDVVNNDFAGDEQDPELLARKTNDLARELIASDNAEPDGVPDFEISAPASTEKAVLLEAATSAAQTIFSDIMSFTGVASAPDDEPGEDELIVSKKDFEDMEDELTRLNSELRQKDDIIAQLKLSLESNASVHPKENTKGKDLAEKKKKIEGLKHELGKIKTMKEDITKDVNSAIQSLTGDLATMLNSSVLAIAEHAATGTSKDNSAQHTLATLQGKLDDMEHRAAALEGERADLLLKLAAYELQETQSNQRISEMEDEVKKHLSLIETLKADLACAGAAAAATTHARQLFPEPDEAENSSGDSIKKQDFRAMKVPELKAELERRGLDINGVKNDLVIRLQVYELDVASEKLRDNADMIKSLIATNASLELTLEEREQEAKLALRSNYLLGSADLAAHQEEIAKEILVEEILESHEAKIARLKEELEKISLEEELEQVKEERNFLKDQIASIQNKLSSDQNESTDISSGEALNQLRAELAKNFDLSTSQSAEISELEDVISGLEGELADAKSARDTKAIEVENLRGALEATQADLDSAQNENEELTEKLQNAKKDIENLHKEHHLKTTTHTVKSEEVARLQSEISSKSEALAALEIKLNESSANYTSLEARHANLQKEMSISIENHKLALASIETEKAFLQDEFKRTTALNTENIKKLNDLEKEHKDELELLVKEELDRHSSEVSEISKKLKEESAALSIARTACKNHEQLIQKFEKDLGAKNSEIEKMQLELKDLKAMLSSTSEVDQLKIQLGATADACEKLVAEKTELYSKLENTQKLLESMKTADATKEKRMSQFQKDIEKLEADMQNRVLADLALREEMAKLKSKKQATEEELLANKAVLFEREKRLESLMVEFDDVKKTLFEGEDERKSLVAEISSLSARTKVLEAELSDNADAGAKNMELQAEIDRLSTVISQSQTKISEAEEVTKQLEAKKKRDLENLKKQNDQIAAINRDRAEEVRGFREKIDALTEQLDTTATMIVSLKADISSRDSEIERLNGIVDCETAEKISLEASLRTLETRIADEVAKALRTSEANEDSLQQRVKDAERAQRDMVEKCRIFEKQLEQSEGSHKIEATEHAASMQVLKEKLQELETERKRLQDEVESLETSLSDANKAAVAAQWQNDRGSISESGSMPKTEPNDIEEGISFVAKDTKDDFGKKLSAGTHPLMWWFWSFVSLYCPSLLAYIGPQPPRLCSTVVLNSLFVLYFVFIHFFLFGRSCT